MSSTSVLDDAELRDLEAKIKEEDQQLQKKEVKIQNETEQTTRNSNPTLNIGSLLRLFKSDFFDSWIAISYLFRYQNSGVHDYLCNELYAMDDNEIEFYLIELWYDREILKIHSKLLFSELTIEIP